MFWEMLRRPGIPLRAIRRFVDKVSSSRRQMTLRNPLDSASFLDKTLTHSGVPATERGELVRLYESGDLSPPSGVEEKRAFAILRSIARNSGELNRLDTASEASPKGLQGMLRLLFGLAQVTAENVSAHYGGVIAERLENWLDDVLDAAEERGVLSTGDVNSLWNAFDRVSYELGQDPTDAWEMLGEFADELNHVLPPQRAVTFGEHIGVFRVIEDDEFTRAVQKPDRAVPGGGSGNSSGEASSEASEPRGLSRWARDSDSDSDSGSDDSGTGGESSVGERVEAGVLARELRDQFADSLVTAESGGDVADALADVMRVLRDRQPSPFDDNLDAVRDALDAIAGDAREEFETYHSSLSAHRSVVNHFGQLSSRLGQSRAATADNADRLVSFFEEMSAPPEFTYEKLGEIVRAKPEPSGSGRDGCDSALAYLVEVATVLKNVDQADALLDTHQRKSKVWLKDVVEDTVSGTFDLLESEGCFAGDVDVAVADVREQYRDLMVSVVQARSTADAAEEFREFLAVVRQPPEQRAYADLERFGLLEDSARDSADGHGDEWVEEHGAANESLPSVGPAATADDGVLPEWWPSAVDAPDRHRLGRQPANVLSEQFDDPFEFMSYVKGGLDDDSLTEYLSGVGEQSEPWMRSAYRQLANEFHEPGEALFNAARDDWRAGR